MTRAVLETDNQRPDVANDHFAGIAEYLAWRSHQLAVEIANADSNAVTQTLRRAATAQWRRTFLDLPE